MKSAYEKAMERLEKESGPTGKLSDEQRNQIAEIDRKFDALVAEHKLSSEHKARAATTAAELEQAFNDYRSGKMGAIEREH